MLREGGCDPNAFTAWGSKTLRQPPQLAPTQTQTLDLNAGGVGVDGQSCAHCKKCPLCTAGKDACTLSVRGSSRPKPLTPHARKHQTSTETAEPRCGRGDNSLCGVQPTLRGGHRPSVGHPTAKLLWHFPSRSHNLHRCSQASLCNVLKSFSLTGAEKPSQYLLLAWLVLGLFFWENKQTKNNTKCNGGRERHLEEIRRESRSVQPRGMVATVPGHGTPALSCRRVRQ